MVRVIIKGGVWKNTEDEILKAAISKYGKNQWARISSLLVRKTPKQCKARWYEWLDPSIKKTEWSKEEDEKLLHLAKLMPTQWRTIAPIVGRTANQCLERYQKLLDEAEARDNEAGGSSLGLTGTGESAPSADDVRRLRPGEIDPNPETKPARPDPIDMDEDEKEMLSEARARLANTQGKKAKRKARERALEEARRLAMLQKRRELKAAGIVMKQKPKKGFDYNVDIPFEKKPLPGFYDTSEEASRSYKAPIGKTMRALENRNAAEEDALKKKRQREAEEKSKNAKAAASSKNEDQIRKLKEAEQISKRRKLNLPAAQVGESEFEDIVKLGQAGERARSLVEESGANEATGGLLGDYSALEQAKHARTPQTAPEDSTVMREARNLRNMTIAQTPLLGDLNTPLHEGPAASDAHERAGPVQTPNPLRTPLARGSEPGATPLRQGDPKATPFRTPLRDNLGLNADDSASSVGDTPYNTKHQRLAARHQLRSSLQSLPAPKNDFEIVVDDNDDLRAGDQDLPDHALSVEDAAERDARLARLAEQERLKALARRSQVVQRGLPRPKAVDLPTLLKQFGAASISGGRADVQTLIGEEMARLIHHDSIEYPLPGSDQAGSVRSQLPHLSDEELQRAREAMHQELAGSLGFPGATPEALKRLTAAALEDDEEICARFDAALYSIEAQSAWHPQQRCWVDKSSLAPQDVVGGLSALLELRRQAMAESAALAAKGEKTLGKLLGGYQARSKTLAGKIKESFDALAQAKIEQATFERLRQEEEGAVLERLEKLRGEVEKLERQDAMAQKRYKDLDDERSRLKDEYEAMQAEIDMRAAEVVNDRALLEE
ncbi:Pre-mRNA-splicing factor cef1 [Thecaphora frezii]